MPPSSWACTYTVWVPGASVDGSIENALATVPAGDPTGTAVPLPSAATESMKYSTPSTFFGPPPDGVHAENVTETATGVVESVTYGVAEPAVGTGPAQPSAAAAARMKVSMPPAVTGLWAFVAQPAPARSRCWPSSMSANCWPLAEVGTWTRVSIVAPAPTVSATAWYV